MEDRFTGRVAVVTGGARGIGAAVIAALVEEGARAVSIDLNDPDEPRERTRDIRADVTDRTALAAAFETIDAVEGRIDVLVNNAGLQRVGRTEAFDPDLAPGRGCPSRRDVPLHGPGHPAPAPPGRRGRVALLGRGDRRAAGAGTLLGGQGRDRGLHARLAVELAPDGIRVNAIAPGVTLTPLVQQGLDDGSIHDDFVTEIPMRRFGTADEIARAIRFLASDEASYITGATLVVDGGWTIQGMPEPASRLGGRLTRPGRAASSGSATLGADLLEPDALAPDRYSMGSGVSRMLS